MAVVTPPPSLKQSYTTHGMAPPPGTDGDPLAHVGEAAKLDREQRGAVFTRWKEPWGRVVLQKSIVNLLRSVMEI